MSIVKIILCSFIATQAFGFSPKFNEPKSVQNFKESLSKLSPKIKSIPAAIGTAALLFGNPIQSNALPSGGRSGGSSFRSSPSTRSFSAPSTRSYSSPSIRSGPSINIYSTPSYGFSPFGYSPFGYGLSPFSFVPINGNVLLLGLMAYAAYSLLQNRAGGSDFSNEGGRGSLGSGATVIKLQLALDTDWAESGNIMSTLSDLASRPGLTSGRSELAQLLSEASIALLRRKASWVAASVEGERFNWDNTAEKSEPYFQKMTVNERAKFERETKGTMVAQTSTRAPTQAIVSLIVAMRGKSDALRRVTNSRDMTDALQSLASEALTDEGENVMAVEVLWTPSEVGRVVSERDILMEYPELIRL